MIDGRVSSCGQLVVIRPTGGRAPATALSGLKRLSISALHCGPALAAGQSRLAKINSIPAPLWWRARELWRQSACQ